MLVARAWISGVIGWSTSACVPALRTSKEPGGKVESGLQETFC